MYPISGGVIQSVVTEEEADTYHKVYVDGLANCMEMLELSLIHILLKPAASDCVRWDRS